MCRFKDTILRFGMGQRPDYSEICEAGQARARVTSYSIIGDDILLF